MAERIVLTHVNLASGFTASERRMLLLIRALSSSPLAQKLVVKKGSPLHAEALEFGIHTIPLTWPWRSAVAGESDLVHAHGQASWRWAATSRRPYLASVDTPAITPSRSLLRSSCAVATTRSQVDQLHAVMAQLPVERIPPMYDDRASMPADMQQSISARLAGRFVFGLYSDYTSTSGVADAIEAMRWLVTRNPKAHLLVVGAGKAASHLQARLRSLDAVTLLEHACVEAGWYELFDAYISPARAAIDDNGLVQAMYAGLPIIATRVPAMYDFIQQGQSAIMLPSLDVRGLGESMQQLMQDNALALRLGSTAQNHVKKFSPQLVSERAFRLYLSVASQPHHN